MALFIVIAGTSCQKRSKTADAEQRIDVCALLSREDVQSIQGSAIKETKSNANTNGGFHTSDCLYEGESDGRSVTLSVVQKNANAPKAIDPREYWNTSFRRYSDPEKEKEKETEAEREKSKDEQEIEVHPANVKPPQRIEGLGEAAFWATDFNGGALYVLKGDVFIRVRVSGPESEDSRIDKSKALAAKAISRL